MLESLPGVGRKTASVVLSQLFGEPSFAVDTHVFRVSKRLGITKEKDDLLVTEKKLKKFFNKDEWNRVNSQLVLFGRYNCTSKNPKCDNCNLNGKCKYKKE
jgi:endonuclease-3